MLVVERGVEPERGYWGEVLTTGAEARGIVGLVIDGGVRDVDALEAHGFPVFSSMIALRGATKEHAGRDRRRTRSSATSIVHEGDWIVADADGVVVVPHADLDDVLAAGQAREAKEAGVLRGARRRADDHRAARPRHHADRPRLSRVAQSTRLQRVAVGVRDLAADRVVVGACTRRTTTCRHRRSCTVHVYFLVRAFSARYLFERMP